jgi:catechol-2,3-dioxygenase
VLADWLTTDHDPDFEALRREAPSVHERAATTAVIAHRHLAAGDPEAARALLQDELDADEMAPVDHAWLHLQLARAHQELANLDEARRAATPRRSSAHKPL